MFFPEGTYLGTPHRTWHHRRPWGSFVTVHSSRKATVKVLTVDPGESLSLQYHKKRDEFWTWILGPQPRITIGNLTFWMEAGMEYTIPRKVKHRIENPHEELIYILEVSLGKFNEDDIVRLEDKYGRE